jgi:hypothetical protein
MPITLEHVKEATKRALDAGTYKRLKGHEHVAVFIRPAPLKGGTELRIGYTTYKVEKDAYLVFIDLKHDANFQHPVLYELHNLEDGSIRTIEEKYPIADQEFERSLIPHILPGKEGK